MASNGDDRSDGTQSPDALQPLALESEERVETPPIVGLTKKIREKLFHSLASTTFDAVSTHHDALRVLAQKQHALDHGLLDGDLIKLQKELDKQTFVAGDTKSKVLEALQSEQVARLSQARERAEQTRDLVDDCDDHLNDTLQTGLDELRHLIVSDAQKRELQRDFRNFVESKVEDMMRRESERAVNRFVARRQNSDESDRDTAQSAADLLDAPATVNALIAKQMQQLERKLRLGLEATVRAEMRRTLEEEQPRNRSNSRPQTPRTPRTTQQQQQTQQQAKPKPPQQQQQQQPQQQQQHHQQQHQQPREHADGHAPRSRSYSVEHVERRRDSYATTASRGGQPGQPPRPSPVSGHTRARSRVETEEEYMARRQGNARGGPRGRRHN